MKPMRDFTVTMMLTVALCGCRLDVPPIASGTYTTYVAGSPGPRRELTSDQRQALTTWLGEHRSEWSRTVVTHVPGTLVSIQHIEGSESTLNLWPRSLMAYGQFGQLQRSLTEEEGRRLAEILGL
jgi:hypothetical protein